MRRHDPAPMGLVVALALLVGACAGLGFATPQSFDERLAFAYASHTAVLHATANSLDVEAIESRDARQVLELADQSRALLDAARLAANAGDIGTAEGRLSLAINVLQQLQSYLNTRGAT